MKDYYKTTLLIFAGAFFWAAALIRNTKDWGAEFYALYCFFLGSFLLFFALANTKGKN
jgi:drug/metabolite transporter (DMT)-like permease